MTAETARQKWTIGSPWNSSPGGAISFTSIRASAGWSGQGSCATSAVIKRPRRWAKSRYRSKRKCSSEPGSALATGPAGAYVASKAAPDRMLR
jgi:hypothetical protein